MTNERIGATHGTPEIGPINQGVKRGLAPKEVRKCEPRIQGLGLYGVETCRVHRHRYQTPLNLLIYRRLFGDYERVTDFAALVPEVCPSLITVARHGEGNWCQESVLRTYFRKLPQKPKMLR